MKIRYDFVTNSSSTSFIIISDGTFNFKEFMDAIGLSDSSAFKDIYKELFDIFKDKMRPIREEFNRYGKGLSFEEYVKKELWKSGEELLPKIMQAEKDGKKVYIGALSSDGDEVEGFFCTDDFVIESDKIFIDAKENGW